MDSLERIGEGLVKATEFIGQSSGKDSKGQSQKTQQSVLQKFRSGGYNVIVATSIGEEGLDIMEVDLVICFDANISPLRMTQRMGRTGRKRDGRVVVLACEGVEMKGYLRKQEKSKAIKKLMRNASKSFDFHSSPRMIPHTYKPETQFVKFSIEEFVPQGKRAKSSKSSGLPFLNEISDQDKGLVNKYFDPLKNNTFKPSLIAFPSCQSFPTSIYKVSHSFRTTNMLIDAMQQLQGLTFPKKMGNSSQCLESMSVLRDENQDLPDLPSKVDLLEAPFQEGSTDFDAPKADVSSVHIFLFGGDKFMNVDLCGHVSVSVVPSLPFNLASFTKNKKSSLALNAVQNLELENEFAELSPRLTYYIEEGLVPESPIVKLNTPKSLLVNITDRDLMNNGLKTPLANQVREVEDASDEINGRLRIHLANQVMHSSSNHWKIKSGCGAHSSVNTDTPNPLLKSVKDGCLTDEINKRLKTPLANQVTDSTSEYWKVGLKNITDVGLTEINDERSKTPLTNQVMIGSSSEEWQVRSGSGAHSSVNQAPTRYRRLCRLGDKVKKRLACNTIVYEDSMLKDHMCINDRAISNQMDHNKGKKKKQRKQADAFIEEEAEVSEDASVSGDEEEYSENEDEYEDSFIDDRATNSNERPTQAQNSTDMLAFYRRSLLTQSPMETPHNLHSNTTESMSCSSENLYTSSLHATPLLQHGPHSYPTQSIDNTDNNRVQLESSRKRKLSFLQPNAASSSVQNPQPVEILDCDGNDDDFFNSVDLDLIEAQAAEILRQRAGLSSVTSVTVSSTVASSKGCTDSMKNLCSPSFDLGI